jgi:hypothetical protein
MHEAESVCLNCEQSFEGKYCNHCGQKKETHRLNRHFLIHEFQHSLVHIDKGILYTVKEMFTRPGHSIREFVQGKRINHFKPLSWVLIMGGIVGFLFHYFDVDLLAKSGDMERSESLRMVYNWQKTHFALIHVLNIPIFSLFSWIVFRKKGYNFIEHLVLNAFVIGQSLIIYILLFPLYYLNSGKFAVIYVSIAQFVITFALFCRAYYEFFQIESKLKAFLRTALVYVFLFGVTAILSTLTAYIAALIMENGHASH